MENVYFLLSLISIPLFLFVAYKKNNVYVKRVWLVEAALFPTLVIVGVIYRETAFHFAAMSSVFLAIAMAEIVIKANEG